MSKGYKALPIYVNNEGRVYYGTADVVVEEKEPKNFVDTYETKFNGYTPDLNPISYKFLRDLVVDIGSFDKNPFENGGYVYEVNTIKTGKNSQRLEIVKMVPIKSLINLYISLRNHNKPQNLLILIFSHPDFIKDIKSNFEEMVYDSYGHPFSNNVKPLLKEMFLIKNIPNEVLEFMMSYIYEQYHPWNSNSEELNNIFDFVMCNQKIKFNLDIINNAYENERFRKTHRIFFSENIYTDAEKLLELVGEVAEVAEENDDIYNNEHVNLFYKRIINNSNVNSITLKSILKLMPDDFNVNIVLDEISKNEKITLEIIDSIVSKSKYISYANIATNVNSGGYILNIGLNNSIKLEELISLYRNLYDKAVINADKLSFSRLMIIEAVIIVKKISMQSEDSEIKKLTFEEEFKAVIEKYSNSKNEMFRKYMLEEIQEEEEINHHTNGFQRRLI